MVCLPCAAPFLLAGAGTGTAAASSKQNRIWIIVITVLLTLLMIGFYIWKKNSNTCTSCISE
jgi:hypothetical protein